MEKMEMRRVEFWSDYYNRMFPGHIEYKKTCIYCKSLYWAKRKTANYCSNACRNLARQDKKRDKLI